MIAIVNVSNNASAFGVHEYELRINSKVITRFEHTREEGLAVCLQKASVAAEKAKWAEVLEVLKTLEYDSDSMLTHYFPKVKK